MDRQTDGWTFAILELLLRLKTLFGIIRKKFQNHDPSKVGVFKVSKLFGVKKKFLGAPKIKKK